MTASQTVQGLHTIVKTNICCGQDLLLWSFAAPELGMSTQWSTIAQLKMISNLFILCNLHRKLLLNKVLMKSI